MAATRTPKVAHELVEGAGVNRAIADLERALSRIPVDGANIQIRVESKDRPEEMIPIAPEQFRVLAYIVRELAQGHGVSLIPMEAELTTNEAARQLKVSRPFLVGLLEKGEIPYRMVGSHRRIRYRDLLAYKQRTDRSRSETLEELSALDQEYGLG